MNNYPLKYNLKHLEIQKIYLVAESRIEYLSTENLINMFIYTFKTVNSNYSKEVQDHSKYEILYLRADYIVN